MTTPAPPAPSPRLRRPTTPRRTLTRAGATALTYAFLLAGAALMVLPFVFSAMTALKTPGSSPPPRPHHP